MSYLDIMPDFHSSTAYSRGFCSLSAGVGMRPVKRKFMVIPKQEGNGPIDLRQKGR